MCISPSYVLSNAVSTKFFVVTILAGVYDIIVLRAHSRHVFNSPTIVSNSFISNPVSLSLFPQV